MFDRRQFTNGLVSSLALAGSALYSKQPRAQVLLKDDPLPKLFSGTEGPDAPIANYAEALTGIPLPDTDPSSVQQKSTSPLGTNEPSREEKYLGQRIINGAPIACTPIEVAEYFRPDTLVNKFGVEAGEYARGWPASRSFNPVIFEFLARMLYVEKDLITIGDKTDWCAAFISWCLLRSRVVSRLEKLPGELIEKYRHPGARSFLCFGQETKQPKPGDIVVWYDGTGSYDCRDSTKAMPISGAGHVAFYLGPSTTLIRGKVVEAVSVLGGNQGFEGLENNQWVCVKSVPKEYSGKKLAAFRTDLMLHAAPEVRCTKQMRARGEC